MILYVFIYKIKLLTITILAYYKYYGYQINNHLFITSKYILLISSCLLIWVALLTINVRKKERGKYSLISVFLISSPIFSFCFRFN